ncbi:hypothetical protein [Microterricola viridarii]|uniref:Uncharacterized protein n=1 Tax=Microterricola viridarii TaxID=412690 RepID=A0A0Y0MI35_9MICO|nr:hypothetical protein [Microterricola viridarii]AMB58060.1 hypothetical protein AWU67_03370 [Microterricola viridarii]
MRPTLEDRYRRMLRTYPREWRAANEDAIVGTLLDVADGENRFTPSTRETLGLIGNGLATRFGASLPLPVRDGVATVALATGAAIALVFFVVHGWAPWAPRDPMGVVQTFGPFMNPGVILYGTWLISFTLALLGYRRAAPIGLGVSVLVIVGVFAASQFTGGWAGLTSTTLGFFGLLAVCGLIGTPASPGRLLIGFAVSVGVLVTAYTSLGVFSARFYGDHYFWMVPTGVYNLGILIAIALLLAGAFALARNGDAAVVTLISTMPWAAAWVVNFLNSRGAESMGLLVGTAIAAAALITIGTVRRSTARTA